ncbi:MAG: hypothetical protein GEEBNDBF_00645 [bacterium]|nr:hypothetical protein [bacterium]
MPEPSPDLIDQTLAVWQPRSPKQLTREDARQILENVTGFFDVLLEWEAAARTPELDPTNSKPAPSAIKGGR